MPDWRRYGADENRGFKGAGAEIRPVAARPAGRLFAPLCALCRALVLAVEPARPAPRRRDGLTSGFSVCREASAAEVAQGLLQRARACGTWCQRRRPVRRYLQSLFRTGERARRDRGAERRRLSGPYGASGQWRTTLVLRPHLS